MANLAQTVNHLLKTVKNHIGRGGNVAHLPVDSDMSGFMTPEMLKCLNSTSGQLTTLTKDNFFELPAGIYWAEGTTSNNAPMSSGYHIVQVFEFLDRKLIYCMHMYTGVIYVYSFNRADGSDETPLSKKGWRTINQRVTLWEGVATTEGTIISLIDSLTRYSKIIVDYTINPTYSYSSIELSTSLILNNNIRFNGINLPNQVGTFGITVNEIAITAKEDPNKIKIVQQKSIHVGSDGQQVFTKDLIEIFRIVGIK